MILVDLSQILIASMMTSSKFQKELDEGMIRHLLLNTIRANRVKFHKQYGEVVLCVDHKHHWRRDVFPFYKANRKKSRDESKIDWKQVFVIFEKLQGELVETFPYPFIKLHGAEGDDVISTIVINYPNEKKLILSSDKDFKQLQRYPNVFQYDLIRSKWIKEPNPELYLREHLIRGDSGDGVPNFLSDDDSLVNPDKKQKSIMTKKLDEWLKMSEDTFYNELSEKEQSAYNRNKMVIDLSRIPDDLSEKIIVEYTKEIPGHRSKLLSYFMKNKLKNLTPLIGDF